MAQNPKEKKELDHVWWTCGHPMCQTCPGLHHTQAVSYRLTHQASLSDGDPVPGDTAAPREGKGLEGLSATPCLSWAETDPHPTASMFPQLEDVCEGLLTSPDPDGDGESVDSKLMLSDGEEEESLVLITSGAAKPMSVEGDKLSPPSQLALDMQDMCKCRAGRLNISWPVVQIEVQNLTLMASSCREQKSRGSIFTELLRETAVTWKVKPYS